ncbi:MAG TPA: molybdopterin-binding protein [Candidatus Limnocylindrales bacterium]|nr:molybdopterin-binding protein [Candidatus Limnocylindrales bacterium]
MKVARIAPGRRAPRSLAGAVLARDLAVLGERWSKGRRLSAADLDQLGRATAGAVVPSGPVTVLVIERGDLHEDDAALRLARAIGDRRLRTRGPAQSRVDLLAGHDGVLHVRTGLLERLNRLDPIEVFSAFDGSVVSAGDLVASVKVAPHVVDRAVVERAERLASRGGPVVDVAPFVPSRIGVIVKESIRAPARERFERSVRAKVESLGSTVASIAYVADDDAAVEEAFRALVMGPHPVDLVLTAGGGSTDPADPFFVAIERLGGRIVRRGVPAHPGSMLWLGRVGRTGVLGLPTCGAYSKATAADLLLPRLLSGEPVAPRTVAKLGHGGILTRDQRFRFPPYARELDAPEG